MLQKEFKTLIAEVLQQACSTVKIQLGTSTSPPTDLDNGLKGAQLVAVDLTSAQDGPRFVVRTIAPILIPTGTATEVVLTNQDSVVMDRLLITPVKGGPDSLVELEYYLEAV